MKKILTKSMYQIVSEEYIELSPQIRLGIIYNLDLNEKEKVEVYFKFLSRMTLIAETNVYPHDIMDRVNIIEFPYDINRDKVFTEQMFNEHLSEMFTWIARGANMYINQSINMEEKYIERIENYLEIADSKDYEVAHISEDGIYKSFIRDIEDDKFANISEAKRVAQMIRKRVSNNHITRWYA
jgi:hypothetical protein